MKKSQPKTPYFLFGVGILYNIFAMVVAVTIFLFMKENATNFISKLLLLLIPIIAGIVVFFDMRFKFQDVKAYHQAK